MNRDGDDAWDPYLDDSFHHVNREDWDESDWEAFLNRQDVLAAKYQELFDTLRDHPRREELIAREMHWSLPDDLLAELDRAPDAPDDPSPDEFPDDLPDDFPDDLPDDEPFDAEDRFADDLDDIPAYCLCQDFALTVERRLTARLRDNLAHDDDAPRAVRAAIDVAGQIANGHGIGYERDTLCGNIVCCSRALRSLAECFDSLLTLRRRGILPPAEVDELLGHGRAASDAIAQRIDDLRRRVWWC